MAYVFSFAYRVVVFNMCGTYNNQDATKNPLPGFTFVYSFVGLIAVLRAAGSGPVRVCFTPINDVGKVVLVKDEYGKLVRKKITLISLFHDCCELVMQYKNLVFAIDEIWHVHPGAAPAQLPEVQKTLFMQWRHFGITPMWAAQMPQLVNSAVRSVSTETYVGKFTDKLDVDAVARCKVKDPQAIAYLGQLEPFNFIHQYENGEWRIERAPAR